MIKCDRKWEWKRRFIAIASILIFEFFFFFDNRCLREFGTFWCEKMVKTIEVLGVGVSVWECVSICSITTTNHRWDLSLSVAILKTAYASSVCTFRFFCLFVLGVLEWYWNYGIKWKCCATFSTSAPHQFVVVVAFILWKLSSVFFREHCKMCTSTSVWCHNRYSIKIVSKGFQWQYSYWMDECECSNVCIDTYRNQNQIMLRFLFSLQFHLVV